MRVLFVFPDMSSTVTNYTGVLSYGVGVLTALLRRDGHHVELLHLTHEFAREEFHERVRAANPDLVAISAISHYAQRIPIWARWAKSASSARVVVGGIHATYAPEEVVAEPAVDFVCIGEGEEAMVELCRALEDGKDPSNIQNLWARDGDQVIRNAPRAIWDDLDMLPDPDFSVFDFPNLYSVRQGTLNFLMSRGCAFRCTYCSAHTLMNVAPRKGKFWRFLSPVHAVNQIARLRERYLPDANLVSFGDAIFFPNRKWLAEFAPLYREQIGLPISCNMRADMVDEEVATTLAWMGVKVVRLGVESGNQHMTRDVLKRNLDVADIRAAYAMLRRAGIERWSYNIVGLPTETLPMALETVRLNAEIDPEIALCFLFYPYPGTELHRLSKEKGFLTGREFDHYKEGVAIQQPQFAEDDVLFVQRMFTNLIRLYRLARRLPGGLGTAAQDLLDRILASRLMPRRATIRAYETYRKLRHRLGETLVARSPGIYRALGGRAPEWGRLSPVAREGLARVDTP